MNPKALILLISSFYFEADVFFRKSHDDKELEAVRKTDYDGHELCMTKQCVLNAARLLENMDQSVNPCDNFYEFACGNFIKTISEDVEEDFPLAELELKIQVQLRELMEKDVSDKDIPAFKMINKFYKMCLDSEQRETDGLDEIKFLINKVGGWPLLEGQLWNESNFDWLENQYHLSTLGFQYLLVPVDFTPDPRNSSRNILYINVQSENSYMALVNNRKQSNEDYISKTIEHMTNLAVAFGADREKIKPGEIRQIISLEEELVDTIDMQSVDKKDYTYVTIKELADKYEFIPWVSYIKNFYSEYDINITENEEVILSDDRYLNRLEKMLKIYNKRTLANFLIYALLERCKNFLNKEVENEIREIFSSEPEPEWKTCTTNILHSFQKAAGAYYVRNYFKPQKISQAAELVEGVMIALKNALKKADWMDNYTRKKAFIKIGLMKAFIGYQEELLDDRALHQYYYTLDIKPEDKFFIVCLKAQQFTKNKENEVFSNPANINDALDLHRVNEIRAYYLQVKNVFIVSAAFLQETFFEIDRPNYMNYGTLGFTVGHEIAHGFDNEGKYYGKDGTLSTSWWSKRTEIEYAKRAQCFVDFYNGFNSDTDVKVNGSLTLDENIADFIGVQHAYLAYQKWLNKNPKLEKQLPGLNYTSNQMYWISMASRWCTRLSPSYIHDLVQTDKHSIPELRILGPFSNSKYFARDFNCPAGSKMNPAEKCELW